MSEPTAQPIDSPSPAPPAGLSPLFGNRKHLAWAAVVFLAATLGVFWQVLFLGGDRVLAAPDTDLPTVFVGWSQFAVGEMSHGHLPLWNPNLFSGAPCLGGFQEALLYPPFWLHLALPLRQALNWGIALHVFLAGLFTYLWMARRGLHPAASVLAGGVFMFGGAYVLHITPGHLPNLRTMVWAPLIFLAIDDLTTTRSLRGAWLGAGAIAMQILAGHPQYVYYTALIAGPYALLGLWSAPSRRRALAGLAVMGVGGALLSAVQLFTGLGAARESLRSGLQFDIARTFPFPPENLLTLVMPAIFGGAAPRAYWGRWFLWEDSLFVGAAAFALAIYGMMRGAKSARRHAILFLAICLLIAFGDCTPLYRVLYDVLPGFSSFRGVSKMAFLAGLFLASVAGIGFDHLLRTPKLSRRAPKVIAVAAIIILTLGGAIWVSGNAQENGAWGCALSRVNWSDRAYRYGGRVRMPPAGPMITQLAHDVATELFWCAGASLLLAGLWLGACWNRKVAFGIAGLAAVELIAFAAANQPTFSLDEVIANQDQLRTVFGHLNTPDGRVICSQPSLVLGGGGSEAWGNDPMVLKRYAEWMALNQGASAGELMNRTYPFFTVVSRTWGMVRVQSAMVPTDDKLQWTPLFEGPHKIPQLQRAQLIEAVEMKDNPEQVLAAVGAPDFDPRTKVLLVRPPEKSFPSFPTTPPASGTEPAGTITEVKDHSTDEIEVTADVRRPCILLFSENFSTGWRATPLDGAQQHEYRVIAADYILRAIPLHPGHHHFMLQYRPVEYVVGKWVSLAALVAWIVAGMWLWRSGHRR